VDGGEGMACLSDLREHAHLNRLSHAHDHFQEEPMIPFRVAVYKSTFSHPPEA